MSTLSFQKHLEEMAERRGLAMIKQGDHYSVDMFIDREIELTATFSVYQNNPTVVFRKNLSPLPRLGVKRSKMITALLELNHSMAQKFPFGVKMDEDATCLELVACFSHAQIDLDTFHHALFSLCEAFRQADALMSASLDDPPPADARLI